MEEFRALLNERLTTRGAAARLSDESGISQNVLSRWRAGLTRPSTENLQVIAPHLGVSYERLLRMCGYLPGETAPVAERHPVLEHVNRAWESLEEWRQQAIAALVPGAPVPVPPARTPAKRRNDATAKRLRSALNNPQRKGKHGTDGTLTDSYRRVSRPLARVPAGIAA